MIKYTIFKNIFDNKTDKILEHQDFDSFEKLLYDLSKRKLKSKKDAVLISPAVYKKDTTRANDNVIEWSQWCCVDVDDFEFKGDLKDELLTRFSHLRFVCYSTASSKTNAPKFRLVFPVRNNVPNDRIRKFWFALQSELGELGDKQTKDLSRMYYIPAKYDRAFNFIFSNNNGSAIDPDELMFKHPMPEKTNLNLDAFDVAANNLETWVDVLQVRNGKIKNRDHFQMEVQDFHDKRQILSSFIKTYYLKNDYPPNEIIVDNFPYDKEDIEKFLKIKYSKNIKISKPERGSKKEIIQFLSKNLNRWVEYRENRVNQNEEAAKLSLFDIKKQLELKKNPELIECFDISHIQGTSVVASMVVFSNGKPDKSKYRRFELKNSQKNDDYSALKEIFQRRLKRLENEEILPDLMLVDGGKGQLTATYQELKKSKFKNIQIASIAKQREEIFLPENKESIILKNGSYGKHMIQRIRDEAHRFAVEYHRKKRSKKMISSELDSISGIGPKKKKALIQFFGSVKNIRNSTVEELAKVKIINTKDAKRIKDSIN